MWTCVCVVAISNARLRTIIVELNPELWDGIWVPGSTPGDDEWVPPPSDADSDLYTTTNDSSIVFPGWAASPRGRGGNPWAWGFCFANTTYELSILVVLITLLAPCMDDPCIPTRIHCLFIVNKSPQPF